MSTVTLRLPQSLRNHIKDIARHEGVSINQFVSTAVSEKISAIMTEEYIENRAKKATKDGLKKVLDRVPRRKPLSGDEI
jgi:uncharacterized protein (DUF1778 family)